MKHKFSKIIWRDIAGISPDAGAWMTDKYIQDSAAKLFSQEYISVGEIIVDTKEYVVIAATIDDDGKDITYADVSMIPRSVIIKIIPL